MLERRYRRYSQVGSPSKRVTMEAEDDLEMDRARQILADVFGIADLDFTGVNLVTCPGAKWLESLD